MRRDYQSLVIVLFALFSCASVHAQEKKQPNILIIWGDDVGL